MALIPDTAREIIEAMPTAFRPEKAQGLHIVYQFELSGEGGGTWAVEIADGQCRVKEGGVSNPDLTLMMSAADYVAMVKGELDPIKAFMSGKVKARGDLSLAPKLLILFQR